MARTTVVFYQESTGDVPVLSWLIELRRANPRAYATSAAAIERLAALGHELRRPLVDYLRDGIYELRIRRGRVNYRILYFFHGKGLVILAHALTKKDTIPVADLERALRRKQAFTKNPGAHSCFESERED